MNVRFTRDGKGYDPLTKQTLPKGCNVIYHPVFWDVSREWANKIASEHNCKVVNAG